MRYGGFSLFVIASGAVFLTMRVDQFLQNTSCHNIALEKRTIEPFKSWMILDDLYQNVTHTGDIVIENGTCLIENVEFHLIGNIAVRNDATLRIRNAKLILSPEGKVNYWEGIVLGDRSKLTTENATIDFLPTWQMHGDFYDFRIAANDEAQINITDSLLSPSWAIVSKNDSKVCVKNTHMEDVISEDRSEARIHNTTLDSAASRYQSSIHISDSRVTCLYTSENGAIEIVNSYAEASSRYPQSSRSTDNSTLRILDSTLDNVNFGGSLLYVQGSRVKDKISVHNSIVWLKDVSVLHVEAMGNSSVWLINSTTKRITTSGRANVYVGFQLPVFGVVCIPYTWIPVLQIIIILIILASVITGTIYLMGRWGLSQLKKMRQ